MRLLPVHLLPVQIYSCVTSHSFTEHTARISRMSHQIREGAETQNPDDFQQQQLQDLFSLESMNRLALLRLNGLNSKQGIDQSNNKQIQCQPFTIGSNSMKRRSPCSSVTSLQDPFKAATEADNSEPKPKRLFCEQEDQILPGFSVISLPIFFPTENQKLDSSPVLRRCISDPYNPPAANVTPNPTIELHNASIQSPESVNAVAPSSGSGSGLPPLRRCLRRSVSDPTSSPKPLSRSPSYGNIELSEKDASDRKKRMTGSLREMRKWLKDIIHEEEQVEEQVEEHKGAELIKESPELKGDCGRDNEHVYVDKVGDCLVLRFKCPCSQGYEILLSGSHCYYKLL